MIHIRKETIRFFRCQSCYNKLKESEKDSQKEYKEEDEVEE